MLTDTGNASQTAVLCVVDSAVRRRVEQLAGVPAILFRNFLGTRSRTSELSCERQAHRGFSQLDVGLEDVLPYCFIGATPFSERLEKLSTERVSRKA